MWGRGESKRGIQTSHFLLLRADYARAQSDCPGPRSVSAAPARRGCPFRDPDIAKLLPMAPPFPAGRSSNGRSVANGLAAIGRPRDPPACPALFGACASAGLFRQVTALRQSPKLASQSGSDRYPAGYGRQRPAAEQPLLAVSRYCQARTLPFTSASEPPKKHRKARSTGEPRWREGWRWRSLGGKRVVSCPRKAG